VIRRALQAILLPVIVLGGYVLAGGVGGFLEDAWEDFLGPFLITYWIGFGFTMAWDLATESMHAERLPPLSMAITGVLGALILLSMLGGVDALIDDPWLFGVAIAPGLRLAGPWVEKHKQAEASHDS
jgi:hypothetical protein